MEKVIKINVPVFGVHKAVKITPSSTISELKKTVASKLPGEIKDILNYDLYLHGQGDKQGKWLDDRQPVKIYNLNEQVLCF